ncbi:MAG: DUF2459 domain-containing protein [Xanthobacteraceae bacterium]
MRRFAARLGIALGVIALFAIWMVGGAAWITARPADPMLWPARDERIVDVYVISNGYHAGLALPRAWLAEFASARGYPALIAVAQRFAAFDWIEFGWGEREFYQSVPVVGDMNLRLALRALFHPENRSVVHVVGISGDPTQAFRAEMMKVPLSWNGFDRILAKLDATFVPPQNGALPDLGGGLYGPSLFYPATGRFGITRVCNHWIGDLLGAAGLPANPVLATVPQGLLFYLRWRAGLRPVNSAQKNL